MPFIPRVEPQPIAAAPTPVLNTVRTPRADRRGAMAAAGQLANASRQEMINPAPFMAPGEGMQAIGQGIQKVGSLAAYVATQAAQENVERLVAEASNRLDMRFIEESGKMREMDPAQTEEHWRTVGAQALSDELQNPLLPPIARHRLEIHGKNWLGQTGNRVKTASQTDIFERIRAQNLTTSIRAAKDGDRAAFDESNKELVKKNRGTALDVQHLENQWEREEKERAQNQRYDEIRADPRAWLANNSSRGSLPADEYDASVSFAKRVDRENISTDADALENAISAGEITVPSQVDTWQPENPRITPRIRELAKMHVARRTDAVALEVARATAPEASSKLMSEIALLDPDKANDQQFHNLRQRVAELPEGYRELPYSRLMRKWRKYEGEDEPDKTLLAYGEDILQEMMQGGSFGPYTHTKQKTDKDGNPLFYEEGDQKGQPKVYHEFVRGDWEKALGDKVTLGGKLSRFLQTSKKELTTDDVRKFLRDNTDDATRAGDVDRLSESLGLGSGDPGGVVNDLPSGPAAPGLPLIPFILPTPPPR